MIHSAFGLARAAQASGDGSLTVGEVLANVPHDAAALVVYAMVAGSVGLIWWGHRHASQEHHGYDRLTKLDEAGDHESPPDRRTGARGRPDG